jgi:hypothetical protein
MVRGHKWLGGRDPTREHADVGQTKDTKFVGSSLTSPRRTSAAAYCLPGDNRPFERMVNEVRQAEIGEAEGGAAPVRLNELDHPQGR